MLDVGDGGGILSDALLDAIECTPAFPNIEDEFLSLNALTNTPKHNVVQLHALVNNQVMLILVDTGSFHTFVNSEFVKRVQASKTSINPLRVKVANGQVLQCNSKVKDLRWWIQGHTFQHDAKIISLGAYHLILGMDWLEQLIRTGDA